MIKIRFHTRQQADRIKDKGMKAFSQIIPSYNINIEEYRPVTQCYKCYQFSYHTNQCKETEESCSKCATKGHNYKQCQSNILKYINCNGDHTSISFKCPNKKTAQQQQNSKTPLAPNQTYTSYAKVTTTVTPVTNAPTTTPLQSDSSTDKQILYDFIINYSFPLSNGDLDTQTNIMNDLLKDNNLPTIKIPSNFYQKYQTLFQQNNTEDTHEQTSTAVTTPTQTPPNNTSTDEVPAAGISQTPVSS